MVFDSWQVFIAFMVGSAFGGTFGVLAIAVTISNSASTVITDLEAELDEYNKLVAQLYSRITELEKPE